MKELVKQRLVGIGVLILMMVVVMPWLLNHVAIASTPMERGEHELTSPIIAHSARMRTKRPSMATAKQEAVDHQRMENKDKPLVFHQQTKAELPKAIEQRAEPAKPVLAWYVQASSFSTKKNADLMMLTLDAKHVPAIIQRHAVQGKRVYRVYLGPYSSRKQAIALSRSWVKRQVPIVKRMRGQFDGG